MLYHSLHLHHHHHLCSQHQTRNTYNARMTDDGDKYDFSTRRYDIGEHAQALSAKILAARKRIVVLPCFVGNFSLE